MDYKLDDDEIIEYIRHNYCPEDVFAISDLEYWALSNDYVKENE